MKQVKAVSMKDYEYKAEKTQEKKQAKAFRQQRKNRKNIWSLSE